MSLADELLATARHLAAVPVPTQGDLRRAISTAYYALFHRLIEEATQALVSGGAQQQVLARQFSHTEMRNVCRLVIKSPTPPAAVPFIPAPLPADLKSLADTFLELQDLRHGADYDAGRGFIPADAGDALQAADDAFAQLARLLLTPAAKPFLLLLLVGEPKLR